MRCCPFWFTLSGHKIIDMHNLCAAGTLLETNHTCCIPRPLHSLDGFAMSNLYTYIDLGSRGYFGVQRRSYNSHENAQWKTSIITIFCVATSDENVAMWPTFPGATSDDKVSSWLGSWLSVAGINRLYRTRPSDISFHGKYGTLPYVITDNCMN